MISRHFLTHRNFRPLAWLLALLLCGQSIVMLPATRAAAHSATPAAKAAEAATKARVAENYGKLPLSFEANRGQVADAVKFVARGQGYGFSLTSDGAVLDLRRSAKAGTGSEDGKDTGRASVRMKLVGANKQPRISGADELPGKMNYFLGSDPKQWRADVPTFGRVKYQGVYTGIDVVYYGNQQQLEYDFIVAPGADPNRIKLSFAGVEAMRVDAGGDLVLETKAGEVRQHKPVIYQEVNGARQPVAGRYAINKDQIGIEVGAYDASKPLVIDPVVSYATYLGAVGNGNGEGITVDAAGCAYVTGYSVAGFTTTPGAIQTSYEHPIEEVGSGNLVYVAKLSADGTKLIYSALIGGSRGIQVPAARGRRFVIDNRSTGIAIDTVGNAYVTGSTISANFPVTPGAIETSYDPTNPDDARSPLSAAYVFKLNATGSQLLYSTLLGRGDAASRGIKVDAGGNAYITGFAGPGLRTTSGAYQTVNGRDRGISVGQTAQDAFVAKLNPTGTTLVYSTFLGGGGDDRAYDIALDAQGNAYITGITGNDSLGAGVSTTPFPTTLAPFETFNGPGSPGYVFVAKFNPTGSALVYSVFLCFPSGFSEYPSIAVDAAGETFITGTTRSTTFPTTPGAFQRTGGGVAANGDPNDDVFVSKLNAACDALIYSTYLGGAGVDRGRGIAIDAAGEAYVTGLFRDASGFIAVKRLNAAGSALVYSSVGNVGGSKIAVDVNGDVYVVGSADVGLVTTPGAIQPTHPGTPNHNAPFVAKVANPRPVLSVSAASYTGATLASESIITAFGTGLATSTQIADANPLPTALAGTTVKVKDSAGIERNAPLFFVSPTQINYLLPAGTANGAATITVTSGDGSISNATAQIASVAPGLFTADASGRGVAAAVALRVKADGTQSYEPIARFDPAQSKIVGVPIDLGAAGDQVFLIAYGTGLRNRSGMSGVTASLGGTNAPALFVGAQTDFVGLDQINLQLPHSLAGRGEVDVVLNVDSKTANTVKVWIK